MAGTPIRTARRKKMEQSEEEILILMASPMTLNQIAAKYEVGYGTLRKWMEAEPSRKEACEQARRMAADAIAERAIENAHETRDRAVLGLCDQTEVAATKVAIDVDKWAAGVWNRNKYSEKRDATVTLNIGSLHLDALRHVEVDTTDNTEEE